MPWAVRRRSPAGSWNGTRIICWSSRPIRARRFWRQRSVVSSTASPAAPRAARSSMLSTTAMAGWSGRLVRRRVFVCPEAASLEALRAWPGLRTVLAVETIRGVNGSGTVEAEIRYFLSSCDDDPKVLIQAIRRHWTIENGLHWVLDVTFREDDSRVRDRTAARNLAILRKVAINLISHGRTAQISMRARRKQAAWNDEYMLSLLTG